MFQFHLPWLLLLLPLPVVIRWLAPVSPKAAQKKAPELYFPGYERLKKAFPAHQAAPKRSGRVLPSLLFLAWACLLLALMQPEKVDQFRHVKNKGYDLMLAVDISASMQAADFSTSSKVVTRLDATKEVVGRFVQDRQGDRVGLITFGEHAYLHVPLTLDTLSVSRTLSDTVSGMAGSATAIGDAIGLAVRSLRDRPEGSRVLILLTDGEDNSSSIPPIEAAKLAKQYGIKIYTIGIGKNGPVPFPTKYGDYVMAEIPIDEKLLQEIASLTGGHFFRAKDKKILEAIYQKINQLEKTESNESIYLIREPLYYYPLAAGMILLLIATLVELLWRRPSYGI